MNFILQLRILNLQIIVINVDLNNTFRKKKILFGDGGFKNETI